MLLGSDGLGFSPLASSHASDSDVSLSSVTLTISTHNADIATGGAVRSGYASLVFTTIPATISTSGVVAASTLEVDITSYPTYVVTCGSVIASNATIAFTTYAPSIVTAGYIRPSSGSVVITGYPADVFTEINVYASVESLSFQSDTASVSTGAAISASTAHITLSVSAARIKMGRNPKLWQERQKFSADNLVVLFELDATALGGTLMRFTSSVEETDVISFGGNDYYPVPVEATGFESSGKGTLPTPVLRILNTPTLQSGVISLKDLVGATLYRIRTFKSFLDSGSDPDANAKFPVDVYKIERKTAHNKVFIEWELSAAMDQEGKMIPARQIIRDYCTHIYRVWNAETNQFDYSKATCPFVGTVYRDANDAIVAAPNDRCGKRLSSCSARFGNNAVLPTRAFPGVAKV